MRKGPETEFTDRQALAKRLNRLRRGGVGDGKVIPVQTQRRIALVLAISLATVPGVLGTAGAAISSVEPECFPLEEETGYVCEFPDPCETDTDEEECQPPASCELIDTNVVRCKTGEPVETIAEVGADAEADDLDNESARPNASDLIQPTTEIGDRGDPAARCGWDADNSSLVCQTHEDCDREDPRQVCRAPAYCEPIGEQFYRCEPQAGQPPRTSDHPGACERIRGGDLACERVEDPRTHTDGESPRLAEEEVDARQAVREALLSGLKDATHNFEKDLSKMRVSYEGEVEELRVAYQQGKDELRVEYQECRASIPSDLDERQRNQRLQSCLQTARADLDELRTKLVDRHQEIKQTYKHRAETARQDACEQATRAALEAIGDRALLDRPPGEMLPEEAMELCPSLGTGEEAALR